jgi:hypothetical protein
MDVDGTKINTIPQNLYSFETPGGVEGYGTEIVSFRSVYIEAMLHHSYQDHVANIKTLLMLINYTETLMFKV